MKLIVVESPTKSRKIQQFVGSDYDVDSCVGHVRDLPSGRKDAPEEIKDKAWAEYGVDIENGFKPYYITIEGKEKVLRELRSKLKQADELILATDPDREGESISWHLLEALKPKVPTKRVTFEEITKDAVRRALQHPRDVDMNLVQAQEARRILDRLYG
ncbi:MAG TPA: toprim domain-containing protein, partial [Candidatus Thermoplasmatota archaeon]|nr:toprim domain-containing protein [Candidatus Thermoplasmatota archaeon]